MGLLNLQSVVVSSNFTIKADIGVSYNAKLDFIQQKYVPKSPFSCFRSGFKMQDLLRRSAACLCIVFVLGAAFVMMEFSSIIIRNRQIVKKTKVPTEIKSLPGQNKSSQVTRSTIWPVSTRPAPTHYLTVNFEGRLGNQIFEFASMFGIAKHNNLIPIIPPNSLLRRIFKISVDNTRSDIKLTRRYHEKKGCTFEPALMSLGGFQNVWIKGYLQSWKYFQHIEKELRRQYTFQDHIALKAKSTFQSVISEKKITSDTVFVAVHVRRGDMKTNQNFVNYGYTTAGIDYLERAMNTFRKDFNNILFVVGSDDLKWCRENLKKDDTVFIPPGSSPEMDVAILTNCNHAVMTVGSYGWWTAWLINGRTIYYKGYPTPKSSLAALFKAEDYYLPHWVPM
ncbi:galactoside alpha-(1,2)-fucosyltransferase 2-like [Saccostrea echinata]|uniref:galactoside alpha-(1,2)-fucosyltransferase 2-like n=1 Tax=Saccostrea echinata TaxID=191078 RepID=UPI002A82E830|nr:galactoside alpha-(1,2)-fucosyltransferase 2-like [Saccostrea echinata]